MSESKTKAKEGSCNALLTVGTYHAVMAGLVFKQNKFYIKFSVKRHVGCLNQVASNDKYIASCGVDEKIFLFTNKADHKSAAIKQKLRKLGEMMPVRLADLGNIAPPAEVTVLRFCESAHNSGGGGSSFLLCGTGEGQLLLYRTRDWSLHNALSVHEKGVVDVAVHPGSGGMLVLSVGQDRSVAVMDLAKGKLLTKWKYNRSALEASESEAKEEGGETGEEEPRRLKKRKLDPITSNEIPIGATYTPKGTHVVIFARFSFIIYDSQTLRPSVVFFLDKPQPSEELYCCVCVGENNFVFGNEEGHLKLFLLDRSSDSSKKTASAEELRSIPVLYPAELSEEVEKTLSTPVNVNVETKLKHPLRHTARVKCLRVVNDVLFSVDSNGVVIAWRMAFSTKSKAIESVTYITSANCRGRVTCMESLEL